MTTRNTALTVEGLAVAALETLAALMGDPDPGVRLDACNLALSYALGRPAELAVFLEALDSGADVWRDVVRIAEDAAHPDRFAACVALVDEIYGPPDT